MRRLLTLLLIAFLISTTLPAGSAQAAAEMAITGISIWEEGHTGPSVKDGGTISRLASQVEVSLNFSRPSQIEPNWITVRDSQGRDPGWTVNDLSGSGWIGIETHATVAQPLPAGETYTITFKAGMQSWDGQTLDHDLSLTLQTTATWGVTSVNLLSDNKTAQIGATDGVTVDQGVDAIQLKMTYRVDPASLPGNVTLTDSQGASMDWQARDGGAIDTTLYVSPGRPLAADQSYTVRLKGGQAGVKTVFGEPLPADYTFTFQTTPGTFMISSTYYDSVAEGYHKPIPAEVGRYTSGFYIETDRRIDCASAKTAVTVTNGQGERLDWELLCLSNYQGAPTVLKLNVPNFGSTVSQVLARAESYTIQVKGGPEGLRSTGGMTLAEDLTLHFTTKDEPMNLRYFEWRYNGGVTVDQTEVYPFWAEAGRFGLSLAFAEGAQPVKAVLVDDETGETLASQWLRYGQSGLYLTLPKSGYYVLYLDITPSVLTEMAVEGMDLRFALAMPDIALPAIKPFETHNTPFSFTAQLRNPAAASYMRLDLNDQLLGSIEPATEGASATVTVDPTKLADGLYTLSATAVGSGNDNVAFGQRRILVDRVSTYADVPATNWARPYIEVMSHQGILKGAGDGLFNPGRPLRRDEFAKMLAATLGLQVTDSTAAPFVDMKDDWAKPYLQAVYEAGYMKGEVVDGKRYFHPEQTISRAEAAVTVARVLGYDQLNVGNYDSPLKDWHLIPNWARSSVAALYELQWLKGLPDGTYGPAKSLNRDQAAKVLANFLGMQ